VLKVRLVRKGLRGLWVLKARLVRKGLRGLWVLKARLVLKVPSVLRERQVQMVRTARTVLTAQMDKTHW
jgi:hypothetical protein